MNEQSKTFYMISIFMESGHQLNVVYEQAEIALKQFNEANRRLTESYDATVPAALSLYQFDNGRGSFITVNLNCASAMSYNEAMGVLNETDPNQTFRGKLNS